MDYPLPWTSEKQEGGYGFHIKDATGKAIAQVWRQAVADIILKGVNGGDYEKPTR